MKVIEPFIISLVAVFAPIQAALLTVLVLIFADLILGIWAAYKRKEHISSSGFRRTVVKLLIYEIAIMLGFLAETYLTGSLLPVSKLITCLIGVTEIKSILENLNDISSNDLFKSLLDKLNNWKE